jgi:hypothetical protein
MGEACRRGRRFSGGRRLRSHCRGARFGQVPLNEMVSSTKLHPALKILGQASEPKLASPLVPKANAMSRPAEMRFTTLEEYMRYRNTSYRVRSQGSPIERQGPIGPIMGAELALPESTFSRSKSWPFDPDPIVIASSDGVEFGSMGDMTFTVVELEAGSFIRTYCSLNINTINSFGWSTFLAGSELVWDRQVLDENGGVLAVFQERYSVACINNPPYFERKNLDNFYDLVNGAFLNILTSSWRQCS